MELINKKIKELYKSKTLFCSENGHKSKDFASKLSTLQNKVDWINEFLKPINLEIQITNKVKKNTASVETIIEH